MKRATDLPKVAKETVLLSANLSDAEVRMTVATYYMFQELRKRCDMQIRHLGDKELPALLRYTADSAAHIEAQITKALLEYVKHRPVGPWLLEQYGIGPIISAGLLAHLDITKAPTVGHWWSFGGLNPERKWEKGQKRPWNANLKQVLFHAGQCFKRVSGKPEALYGQLYRAQKTKVEERNAHGDYAERAKTFVTTSAEVRKTLKQGQLPAGNLDMQACRYATKIFLSHLHGVWYWTHFKSPPPKPFAIAHLGHVHEIKIPNLEMFPGLEQAYYGPRREAA